ncbi:hypothetical protein [Streptomyces sp. NPDC005181]|uniref:hypothetical protein n=1 Tax=Streptomyces sp. NPDC005181 TaxID=3156869 RepID=UPI0032546C5D
MTSEADALIRCTGFRPAEPLALDAYADSGRTGPFLLIDPADGTTWRRAGRARP